MMSQKRPRHGGVLVGKTLSAGRGRVIYQAERELHAQDVVEFRDDAGQTEYEYTLGKDYKTGDRVSAKYQRGCRITPGDPVYRTRDAQLLEDIQNRYLKSERKHTVSLKWEAEEGKPVRLCVLLQRHEKDGGDVKCCVTGQVCQRAQRQPADAGQVRKILCQTGETPFTVGSCEVELKGALFLPVGEVKRLRRAVLQKLQDQLEKGEWMRSMPSGGPTSVKDAGLSVDRETDVAERGEDSLPLSGEDGKRGFPGERIVSVLTAAQAEKALKLPDIQNLYLRMDEMTEQELRRLILSGREAGRNLYLVLPAVFRGPVYERERKRVLSGTSLYQMEQLSGFVIQNVESFVFLRDEVGVAPERMIADACLYIWNRESASFWREQGIYHMTLPLELTGEEWAGLADCGDMQAFVYGRIPLMVSAQCLRRQSSGCEMSRRTGDRAGKRDSGGVMAEAEGKRGSYQILQDGKGRRFFVQNFCKYCYNVIWQEKPLALTGEEGRLRECGIRNFRYDFTTETPEEMEEILAGGVTKGWEGHFRQGVS